MTLNKSLLSYSWIPLGQKKSKIKNLMLTQSHKTHYTDMVSGIVQFSNNYIQEIATFAKGYNVITTDVSNYSLD